MDSYHNYDSSQYIFNAGFFPIISILSKDPQIIHRVKDVFGYYAPLICPKIYQTYYQNWQKEFYAIHMSIRGFNVSNVNSCMNKTLPLIYKFDEKTVTKLNITFGEMTRLLYEQFSL